MKRPLESSSNRCFEDGGPQCCQCKCDGKLRWPDRKGWPYCIDCWGKHGSQAAVTILHLQRDKSLQRSKVAIPRCFQQSALRKVDAAEERPQLRCEVTCEDSLQCARRLLREGGAVAGEHPLLPPIVLNMANAEWVGGGFLNDSSGQEEELCRCSNLFALLAEADREGQYPIPELGCIVTPEVVVFRQRERDGNYCRLEEPFTVAMVTAAAPCHPDLSSEEAREAYCGLMREKMGVLLDVLADLGYDELVLSAWGCGAFRNPPREVARLFREHLTGRFRRSFRRVVFAVYDRPDWPEEGNCAIFRQELLQ